MPNAPSESAATLTTDRLEARAFRASLLHTAGFALVGLAIPVANWAQSTHEVWPAFYYAMAALCAALVAPIAYLLCQLPKRHRLQAGFGSLLMLFACVYCKDQLAPAAITEFSLSLVGLALLISSVKLPMPAGSSLHWFHGVLAMRMPCGARVAGLLFAAGSLVIGFACFGLIPGLTDASAQYIQGKFIAAGQLTGEPHPLQFFFPLPMMIEEDRIFAQYQPLMPLLMGIGHWLNVPWLVDPFFGALSVVWLHRLSLRCFGAATARLTVVLALASPFMLVMTSTYMNHPPALFFTLVLITSYGSAMDAMDARNTRLACRHYTLCGLAFAALCLIRPYTAIAMSLPFAVHALGALKRDLKRFARPMLWALLPALGGIALVAAYNQYTSGDPLMFPSMRYYENSLKLALGFEEGARSSPDWIIKKMLSEWRHLNRNVFLWGLPSLTFAAIALWLPVRQPLARLVLWTFACMSVINMAHSFSNLAYGPRYLYETLPAVLMFSAAGIRRLPVLLRLLSGSQLPRRSAEGMTGLLVLAHITFGMAFQLPGIMKMYNTSYAFHHPAYVNHLYAITQKPALIFLGRWDKEPARNKFEAMRTYTEVYYHYPPHEDDPIIFAKDHGDVKNQELIDYYPGRYVYIEEQRELTMVDAPGP